jgi:hypothetical protein
MMREELFRAALADAADLAKPADLYERVLARRRRRRIATGAIGGAAVLAVAVVLAALVVAARPHRSADPVGPPVVPVHLPTGSLAVMEPPGGEMNLGGVLAHATLTLPAWPGAAACPSGDVKFPTITTGEPTGADVQLNHAVTGDVDGNGSADAVASFMCSLHGPAGDDVNHEAYQVVAFTDLRADRPRTLGRVLAAGGEIDFGRVLKLAIADDGQIRVGLVDQRYESPSEQWREYRWDGRGFAQTGGSPSLPANPPAVALSVNIRGATAVDSAAQKVLTLGVTVRNTGTLDSADLVVNIHAPDGVRPAGVGWQDCLAKTQEYDLGTEVQTLIQVMCPLPPLRIGQAHEMTYQLLVGDIAGTVSVGVWQAPDGAVLQPRGFDNFKMMQLA